MKGENIKKIVLSLVIIFSLTALVACNTDNKEEDIIDEQEERNGEKKENIKEDQEVSLETQIDNDI